MMKKTIIRSLLLLLFLMIFVLFYEYFSKKTVLYNEKYGMQDAMKNIDNYAQFFKDNHATAQIVTDNGKEFIKIKFDSGIEAVYGPELIEINTKVLWKYYSKEIPVDVKISNIDMARNIAQVSTDYDGGYGTTVSYYLPDFYDMKPDWGDYFQADLDVKKIISKEELKELYLTAVQMKERIDKE